MTNIPRVPLVTRDTSSGAFSIDLEQGEFDRTVAFDDSHLVDLAADGRVLSIEILTPDDPKIEDMAVRFGFEDRVPEILAALEAAHAPQNATSAAEQVFVTVQATVRLAASELVPGASVGVFPAEVSRAR